MIRNLRYSCNGGVWRYSVCVNWKHIPQSASICRKHFNSSAPMWHINRTYTGFGAVTLVSPREYFCWLSQWSVMDLCFEDTFTFKVLLPVWFASIYLIRPNKLLLGWRVYCVMRLYVWLWQLGHRMGCVWWLNHLVHGRRYVWSLDHVREFDVYLQ